MNSYHVFRFIGGIFFGLVMVLVVLVVCANLVWHQYKTETDYRHRYGSEWREQYEQNIGLLSDARTKMVVAIIGLLAIPTTLIWLVKVLTTKQYNRSGGNRRESRRREGSLEDRTARYRRNAVVGIYFGLGGIVAGIALVLFRLRIFADHEAEVLLGAILYLGGYLGVISGCWWWLKAKGWTEAVVFIALMPLTIFFVPFMRLIVLASPMIMPVAMTMMTLILVVVVFVLPDKSGVSKRGISWKRRDKTEL